LSFRYEPRDPTDLRRIIGDKPELITVAGKLAEDPETSRARTGSAHALSHVPRAFQFSRSNVERLGSQQQVMLRFLRLVSSLMKSLRELKSKSTV